MEQFETNIFTQKTRLNREYLRDYLILTKKKEYKCAVCGLSEWQNEPLSLKLDFIDSNPYNQMYDNIRFLCPNCFSQIGYNK